MSEKKVYTVTEVKNILGLSKATAYRLIKSPGFPCVQIGNVYRIPIKKFNDWCTNKGIEI